MPVIPGHRSLGHWAGPGAATVVKSEFVYKQSMGSTSSAVSTSVSSGGKYLFGLSFSLLMIVSASLYLSKEAPCIRSEDVQAHTNSLSSLEAKPSAHLRIPVDQGFPIVGEESIMSAKAHGTCASAVQTDLRWNCDRKVADNICCFNRHYAGELSSLMIFFSRNRSSFMSQNILAIGLRLPFVKNSTIQRRSSLSMILSLASLSSLHHVGEPFKNSSKKASRMWVI
jgi:hypothetical protein